VTRKERKHRESEMKREQREKEQRVVTETAAMIINYASKEDNQETDLCFQLTF
jgi:hypothetical protein